MTVYGSASKVNMHLNTPHSALTVHVKKNTEAGHHLEQSLLDDSHHILAGTPDL